MTFSEQDALRIGKTIGGLDSLEQFTRALNLAAAEALEKYGDKLELPGNGYVYMLVEEYRAAAQEEDNSPVPDWSQHGFVEEKR